MPPLSFSGAAGSSSPTGSGSGPAQAVRLFLQTGQAVLTAPASHLAVQVQACGCKRRLDQGGRAVPVGADIEIQRASENRRVDESKNIKIQKMQLYLWKKYDMITMFDYRRWKRDMIRTILSIIFVIICIALSAIILLQEGKTQGLGSIGGMADTYWGRNKSRSAEGTLIRATKIMAVLFIVLSVVLNMNF